MHSFTSSFERPLPVLSWAKVFASALLLFFATCIAIELDLVHLGYHPTVADSKERWADQRRRARSLGKQGLIWIGASRGQLGIDTSILRDKTGLEPVQLAIDGSSFIPVLKGLADDPSITGTILIDYQTEFIDVDAIHESDEAAAWESTYEKEAAIPLRGLSLSAIEKALITFRREHLASDSNDANPLLSLRFRVLPQAKSNQYIVTNPDRSRIANYGLRPMPLTYFRRAAIEMGLRDQGMDARHFEQRLREKLETLTPKDPAGFLQGAREIKQQVDKIEARGGKVVFLEMPTSGMVRDSDDKFYPREQFLNAFEHLLGKTVLISNETPGLKDFICPDGSHLDQRDRTQFTADLVDALGLNKP
jgi:hypothetical protein